MTIDKIFLCQLVFEFWRFLLKKRKVVKVTPGVKVSPFYEHVYEGKHHKLGTRVYIWGVAAHGALGRASFVNPILSKRQTPIDCRLHPHRLEFGEKHKVLDVSCGYGFTVFAVKPKGQPSIFGTGLNGEGQLGIQRTKKGKDITIVPEPVPIELGLQQGDAVIKVSCGRAHTLALAKSGAVYGVGCNSFGQCGRPVVPDEDVSWRRSAIQGLPPDVVQVQAGQDTSFMVTSGGEVWSCGWGADGQHGRGHYGSETNVGLVKGELQDLKVVKVASRADCALALTGNCALQRHPICNMFQQSIGCVRKLTV
ncbi:hypothetical protein HAZT_HAZT009775 [Hyalella azteca]|uniref:Uncharacterized protein n=1 Tax=Hyalella azteca TaxID=294128 RepID=A0A6A0GSJ8_HYAAZ|nr:hypothetical protein HAZT_HAZT009775 [Hyalella azteca]